MTKKHYIALAAANKAIRPQPENYQTNPKYLVAVATWQDGVSQQAYVCKSFAPKFDTARFFAASGY